MTYTVISARHKKTVDGQHGPLQIIALILQDANGPVDAEWATLPSTPVPTEGQQLDGTLESGQYGMKFKRTPAASFGAGGGGARPDDPKRAAHIAWMNAQGNAVRLLQAKATAGAAAPDDFKPSKIHALAEWFYAEAKAVRDQA